MSLFKNWGIKTPQIFLAPMEGVVDPVLRELITAEGGVDFCVTEFVRVTHHLLPEKIFYEYAPELHQNSRTQSGTPVILQLLGSDAAMMGENAARAASLGAFGIDLNFGCPAKTVNNHDGGAALLKTPDRVFKVVEAVRRQVPAHIPVSAKIRLGFDHKNDCVEIAQATESAGAAWLTVHARTKMEAYRPPAHWEYLAPIREALKIPLVANGEIWTSQDFERCRDISGCEAFMIGRGLVANPGLALEVKEQQAQKPWSHWWPFLFRFVKNSAVFENDRYALQRCKQLMKMMGQTYGEALSVLEEIKRLQTYEELLITLTRLRDSQFEANPLPQKLFPKKFQGSDIIARQL